MSHRAFAVALISRVTIGSKAMPKGTVHANRADVVDNQRQVSAKHRDRRR